MSTPPALVTGAARRIGKAMAEGLAKDGHPVVIHYHFSADAAEKLAGEINAAGGRAAAIGCDLGDPAERDKLIAKAAEPFGPLGVLINNASIFKPDTPGAPDAKQWHDHFAVHVEAPAFLSAQFAEQLPEGTDGNVINMIDERVWRLSPQFYSYSLSKSALWTATRTMAVAFAPRIRVNAIGPGPSLKEEGQSEAEFLAAQKSLPLQHSPELAEFQSAVRFILGASSMTGQMIALDGGKHLATADQS
jgi:NAD(P)-dependent dehydrogenase (short-subunit alcohol dehydrogenase family)